MYIEKKGSLMSASDPRPIFRLRTTTANEILRGIRIFSHRNQWEITRKFVVAFLMDSKMWWHARIKHCRYFLAAKKIFVFGFAFSRVWRTWRINISTLKRKAGQQKQKQKRGENTRQQLIAANARDTTLLRLVPSLRLAFKNRFVPHNRQQTDVSSQQHEPNNGRQSHAGNIRTTRVKSDV